MLKYEHKVQRINFAELFLQIKKQTTDVIWWSDECWFRLEDPLNSQNTRIWSTTNEQEIYECPFTTKPIKILSVINGKGEIDFHEVTEHMNADSFIKMFKKKILLMKLLRRMF